MADINGLVKTNEAAKKLTSYPLPARESIFIDEVTFAADAIGTIAVMLDLPIGFIPTDGKLVCAALGTSVTLAVGKRVAGTDTAAAYTAATAANTAGKELPLLFAIQGQSALTAAQTIIITVAGGAATGKAVLKIRGFATMS